MRDQFSGDRLIERLGDDFRVEAVNVDVHVVFEMRNLFDTGGAAVVNQRRAVFDIMNAREFQRGVNLIRRLEIDKIPVNHRLPVGIHIDRIAENLGGVQRGRGGQADARRLEIFDGVAVFAQIVFLAEKLLIAAPFAIQQVAAMRLVHDDAVVLPHAWRGGGVADAAH